MKEISENTDRHISLSNFMGDNSQEFGHIVRMDTLVWKLKLIMSGVDYTNSRLNAVQAEILLLARCPSYKNISYLAIFYSLLYLDIYIFILEL